jgi:hypothetical protein
VECSTGCHLRFSHPRFGSTGWDVIVGSLVGQRFTSFIDIRYNHEHPVALFRVAAQRALEFAAIIDRV